MLLVVDIGNTNITLGIFDNEVLMASWRIASDIHQTTDEYAVIVLTLLKQKNINISRIDQITLCSVVPPLQSTFVDLFNIYFKVSPLVVEPGIKTKIHIRMDNPREVGADRIVDAVAAYHLYGGPAIIVDFGTASTFDTVSKEGEYIGGAIAPGLEIAAEALFSQTAVLPRIQLIVPKKAIGTNTVDAMKSGIIFGYVGLIEGIINRIQNELGEKAFVIATGGYAQLISNQTTIIDDINPDLTLIGLRLINSMNLGNNY